MTDYCTPENLAAVSAIKQDLRKLTEMEPAEAEDDEARQDALYTFLDSWESKKKLCGPLLAQLATEAIGELEFYEDEQATYGRHLGLPMWAAKEFMDCAESGKPR